MEFLQTYRSGGEPKDLRPEQPFKIDKALAHRSAFTKFLLLPVDNSVWQFLQLQGTCWRYVITIYMTAFFVEKRLLSVVSITNFILDAFFLVDVTSALIYRYFYFFPSICIWYRKYVFLFTLHFDYWNACRWVIKMPLTQYYQI